LYITLLINMFLWTLKSLAILNFLAYRNVNCCKSIAYILSSLATVKLMLKVAYLHHGCKNSSIIVCKVCRICVTSWGTLWAVKFQKKFRFAPSLKAQAFSAVLWCSFFLILFCVSAVSLLDLRIVFGCLICKQLE
jgi:hypothetical protein